MSMNWFGVLKAARNVGSEKEKGSTKVLPFTAIQLAEEAGFKATERSKTTDIAAAWIGKLVRWGYVRRIEPTEDTYQISRGRPQRLYELTNWGMIKKAPKRKYWQRSTATKKPTSRKISGSGLMAANPENTQHGKKK